MSRRESLPNEAAYIQVVEPLPSANPPPEAPCPPAAPRPAAPPLAPPQPVEPDLTAVIVVHGMGQQLPFQTLDSVVDGLRRADNQKLPKSRGGSSQSPTNSAQVRVARVATKDLPRVEMTLGGPEKPTKVHLYEAYWAPLTEGAVNLRDVMRFLFFGALNGHLNAWGSKGFHRFMFQRVVTSSHPRARWGLTLALLMLIALVALNAVAAGAFGMAVLGKSWLGDDAPHLVPNVTFVVAAMLALATLCVAGMLLLKHMGFFYALLVDVMLAAACVVALAVTSWVWGYDYGGLQGVDWIRNTWVTGVFWALLFAASAFVRSLLVQYVGDVAAYVSPHKLDRFYDLRHKIKTVVGEVSDAVYADKGSDGKPRYARIAIVGHSLGSVAAYDALNGMINAEIMTTGGRSEIVERTCILLTFGSPLDKTAFIFTAQGYKTGLTREALAAATQPMIQDYEYRKFPWVNVYSKADIVSGSLDLYDVPRLQDEGPNGGAAVENLLDPGARTPIVAHTQYWASSTVFERLHRAVVSQPLHS